MTNSHGDAPIFHECCNCLGWFHRRIYPRLIYMQREGAQGPRSRITLFGEVASSDCTNLLHEQEGMGSGIPIAQARCNGTAILRLKGCFHRHKCSIYSPVALLNGPAQIRSRPQPSLNGSPPPTIRHRSKPAFCAIFQSTAIWASSCSSSSRGTINSS